MRMPRRPEPTSERLRRIVEWADVIFYVFCLVISGIALALALVGYGPDVLRWR
jgi:hypothetical protein